MKCLWSQKTRRKLFWQATTQSSLAHYWFLGLVPRNTQRYSELSTLLVTLWISHPENAQAQHCSLWFSDVWLDFGRTAVLLFYFILGIIQQHGSQQLSEWGFLFSYSPLQFPSPSPHRQYKMCFLWSGQDTRAFSWKGWKKIYCLF